MPNHAAELGWARYALLSYLGIFLVQPVLGHTSFAGWCATAAAVLVFLIAYFEAFRCQGQPRLFACVAVMAALGAAFCTVNAGASTFFVYATAFAAFAPTTRQAVATMAGLMGLLGAVTLAAHAPLMYWLPGAVFSFVVGATNLQVAQAKRARAKLNAAHAEVEYLGKVAERERIARDLHDVLGHTLSVVALKVELASKLMATDGPRALRELAEVQAITRGALDEVRQAIGGYRGQGLAAELARAAATLERAGVSFAGFTPEDGAPAVAPAQEPVLALALREAVTNIVRHAGARHCRVALDPADTEWRLSIEDDGVGGAREGNGLRGMRERVEAARGSLRCEPAAANGTGTRLVIALPRVAES
ncbi:MAG TPA: sensor histidine kinase [Terriglobales bacterium]|nr:sensor histidine kinase [Terriglobales bacterium]